MKLHIALAIAGLSLTAAGAVWIRTSEPARETITIQAAGCRAPVTAVEPGSGGAAKGAVILFHGLSANRRIMFRLGADFAAHGFRVYMPDLSGHGDNTDAFSFAGAEKCAQATAESLMHKYGLDPAKTVIAGHSMGGAFAIRMADRMPVAATIAISPAPMVAPRRMPANLLVFSAQFDVAQLADEAAELQRDAGGKRDAPEDFRQERAFELVRVPFATHTSMLNDDGVARQAETWAATAISGGKRQQSFAEHGKSGAGAINGSLLGLLGLAMMVPLLISAAGKIADAKPEPDFKIGPEYGLLLAEGAVCALVSVLVLALGTPLRFVHLYAGDYLVSAVAIIGALMLLLNRKAAVAYFSAGPRAILGATALGFAIILAYGGWFNWQLTDLWLNGPRWLRFLELLPFLAIFSFSEEAVLGPVSRGRAQVWRFALFLGMRAEIWLACVLAYFALASGQIVLPILVLPFAGFSVAQRLIADGLRKRTGSALAASLFDAILAAWFLAAIFPIT